MPVRVWKQFLPVHWSRVTIGSLRRATANHRNENKGGEKNYSDHLRERKRSYQLARANENGPTVSDDIRRLGERQYNRKQYHRIF